MEIRGESRGKAHFIGIGGVSMSALAVFYKSAGWEVTGSDISAGEFTDKLKERGIKVFLSHAAENVNGCLLVVKNAAIAEDNPEVMAARERNIVIKERAEVLGEIAAQYGVTIAVSGTHGKTTCSGMLASVFMKAGLMPTVHIGGSMQQTGSNFVLGKKDYFITEACEYKRSFLHIAPDTAVILNAEMDHPDCYKDLPDIQNAFMRFLTGVKSGGTAILNGDDRCSAILREAPPCAVRTFGLGRRNNYRAKHIRQKSGKYAFDIYEDGSKLCAARLDVFGRHNIYNALAAAAAARRSGVGPKHISAGLESFSGVKRRYELWGRLNGAEVYHDYAHHPQEIAAALRTAKMLGKDRVICVFQPHTYSRTQRLKAEFVKVLKKADVIFLAAIYPAREKPIPGITSEALAEAISKNKKTVSAYGAFGALAAAMKTAAGKGDLVLILGAGDIENLKTELF